MPNGPGGATNTVTRGLTGKEVPAMPESSMSAGEPERWLPAPGFPHYEVSSLGRVRSIAREILCKDRHGGTGLRRYKSKVLAAQTDHTDRFQVTLYRDKVPYVLAVHALVAAAFIGPRPEGMDICHGPTGCQDNRASNLRYDTHIANMADAIREGKLDRRGVRNSHAKLDEDAVISIRNQARAGEIGTQTRLADEYNLTTAAINQIVKYKTWKHVP